MSDRKLMKKSVEVLGIFELSKIQKSTCPIDIKDATFVASYNWSNSKEPVIFVPGRIPQVEVL